MATNLSALTVASDAAALSVHTPNDYERAFYYNGISGEGKGPELIYRSNHFTTPFVRPTGRFANPVVKSIYPADNTPLGKVWPTVLDQIRDIVKEAVPNYSCISANRFYTHGPDGFVHNPDGQTDGGSLGPPVVWVGAPLDAASPDTAHEVSQTILQLLHKNDVDDVVVEWHAAAAVSRLSGSRRL